VHDQLHFTNEFLLRGDCNEVNSHVVTNTPLQRTTSKLLREGMSE